MTSKKVLILSVVGFLVLVLIFGAVFFFVTYNKNKPPKEPEYLTFDIGELYTNVNDSDRILKVNITVEYFDEELTATLTSQKSKIINGILELFRSKKIEDLKGDKGQQNARVDIRNLVRQLVKSEKVSDIFFVDFIIQ